MNTIDRAKNIILRPKQTWEEIKDESMGISEIFYSYVLILAAIPAISEFIGSSLIGYSFMGMHYRLGVMTALGYSIFSYIMTIIGVYVVAVIANALAPKFDSEKNLTNALKAVAFSMTPSWIAGLLYLIPPLSILAILASIYGLYLFYLGLPLLMNTPKDKSLIYFIVVLIVTIVAYLVIGFITSALFVSAISV